MYLNSPEDPLTTCSALGRFAFDLTILLHFLEEFVRYRLGHLDALSVHTSRSDPVRTTHRVGSHLRAEGKEGLGRCHTFPCRFKLTSVALYGLFCTFK